jgi:hypothetical protein
MMRRGPDARRVAKGVGSEDRIRRRGSRPPGVSAIRTEVRIVNIGRPKRIIEIEPETLPVPEFLPDPQPEGMPEPQPVEPAHSQPAEPPVRER